ncbi:MAG TPA: DsbA family protein [Candidatus Binataceae bacterium]|jgi:predicted DsbA family dithiol-disulfide isomerase|nr:DsbA family protein [Candidatus Binataceae bacterium]
MGNQSDATPNPFRVVMFADFICPYCYIGQERMEQLAHDYDVAPIWRPHWLHPETPPEGAPFPQNVDRERARATAEWLKEMAPEKAARMRFPDKLQCSFFAFEAVEFAQDQGLALPFTSAVYDALWVEGKDIARMATLQEAAAKVGLDAEDMGRALRERRYMEQTLAAVAAARSGGVSSTPTYILGRTAIKGWHYYEVFQTVMEKQGMLPKTEGGTQKG